MKHHILAGLLALGLTGVAQADELIIHTVSLHSKDNTDSTKQWTTTDEHGNTLLHTRHTERYNNVNLGVGYRTDDGLQLGVYYNSYRRVSLYVTQEFMLNANFGAFVGAATGYQDVTKFVVAPIGGLMFKYRLTDKYSLNVVGTPPIGDMDGVVHLMIARKFN